MLTWIKIRRDLWPSTQEVDAALTAASRPDFHCEAYGGDTGSLYSGQVLEGARGGLPVLNALTLCSSAP
jgi:hypothetical protein